MVVRRITPQVRREYGLTTDRARADAAERVLSGSQSNKIRVLVPRTPPSATATPTPTPTAATTRPPIPDVDTLALLDDNRNSLVTWRMPVPTPPHKSSTATRLTSTCATPMETRWCLNREACKVEKAPPPV